MLVGPHGIRLIIRGDTREFLCLQRGHVTLHSSGHCLEARKRAPPQNPVMLHSDLALSASRMMRNNACCPSQPDYGILYHRLSSLNLEEGRRPSERVISINIELFYMQWTVIPFASDSQL